MEDFKLQQYVLKGGRDLKLFLTYDHTDPTLTSKFSVVLAPSENRTGFGTVITAQQVDEFFNDSRFKPFLEGYARPLLHFLATQGWLFRTFEQQGGLIFLTRLQYSSNLVKNIEDADAMITLGCSQTYLAAVARQRELILAGHLKRQLPQFTVIATSFNPKAVYNLYPDGCMSNSELIMLDRNFHRYPFAFRIPYPTAIHTTNGTKLSYFGVVFKFSYRPNLLSFYGTIKSAGPFQELTEARSGIIERLSTAAKSLSLQVKTVGTNIKRIFLNPFVASDGSHEDLLGNRLERKALHGQLFALSLYFESEFCFHPPGDSKMRRGVYDSIIVGCIPVIFESTKSVYASVFDGILFNEMNVQFHDVYWVINPDESATFLFEKMLIAVTSGETSKRREVLRRVSEYFHYAQDDNSSDAFSLTLAAIKHYIQSKQHNRP